MFAAPDPRLCVIGRDGRARAQDRECVDRHNRSVGRLVDGEDSRDEGETRGSLLDSTREPASPEVDQRAATASYSPPRPGRSPARAAEQERSHSNLLDDANGGSQQLALIG